jgi:hypothetical protein
MYLLFLSVLFVADHMSQIDRFLKGPFTDRQGNFNYREWVKVLRINAENEEGEAQTQT